MLRSTATGRGSFGDRRHAERSPTSIPAIRRVLVPTDLSDLGNQAVRYAYATAARGGTVHLLHVVEQGAIPSPLYAHYTPGRQPTPAQRAAERDALLAQLNALVPEDAAAREVATEVDVLASPMNNESDVASAINDAAERIDADLICLGSHGRSGLSAAIVGSVAKQVVTSSKVPVLVVRQPQD